MLDLFLSGDIDLNVLNSYSLVASDMLKIHDISISEFSDNLLNASELYSKQTACFDIFNINNYPGTLLNNSSDLRYILIEDLKARKLTFPIDTVSIVPHKLQSVLYISSLVIIYMFTLSLLITSISLESIPN